MTMFFSSALVPSFLGPDSLKKLFSSFWLVAFLLRTKDLDVRFVLQIEWTRRRTLEFAFLLSYILNDSSTIYILRSTKPGIWCMRFNTHLTVALFSSLLHHQKREDVYVIHLFRKGRCYYIFSKEQRMLHVSISSSTDECIVAILSLISLESNLVMVEQKFHGCLLFCRSIEYILLSRPRTTFK